MPAADMEDLYREQLVTMQVMEEAMLNDVKTIQQDVFADLKSAGLREAETPG